MRVAIAVDKNDLSAVIPGKYEQASALLIVETDTMQIVDFTRDLSAEKMEELGCEVLLCGDMYDPDRFEAVAACGITRQKAGGMTAKQAVKELLRYHLPYITDFVGGTGCGAHEGECTGDCASCELSDCHDRECTGDCATCSVENCEAHHD